VETLGAALTLLGGLVTALGFITLRAREALLDLSPGLTYPKQEWLVTGFHALGALLWRGLSVLVADHPVMHWSAWSLLGLGAAVLVTGQVKRRPGLLVSALAVSTSLLFAGTAFYRTALAIPVSPGVGIDCGRTLSANLTDRVAFEACSWLVNDTPVNKGRRADLGGLLAWLLAACCMGAVTAACSSIKDRRLSGVRWLAAGAHVLLGLLLLCELHRAHAFATWGLLYPQVRLVEKCDPALSQATTAGTCWAFDVSAGAEKKTIFLRGSGCPAGRDGTFLHLGTAETDGGECLATLSSPPRVILHGPTP